MGLIKLAGVLSVCFGVVGGVTALLALFFGSSWWSLNSTLVGTHAVYWVVILFLLYLISEKPPAASLSLPKVILVREEGLLLVESVNWLSIGTACALYIQEGDFEQLSAVGHVENIQENGLVQIRLSEADLETLHRLKDKREKVIVKPGVLR